tara:strand:+ start:1656 stop:2567 length:912 start_codon:yes stop_codon:yes gene_type:complete
MRCVLSFIFFGLTLILSACSSGPSEEEFSPKIGDIDTSIIHYHTSVYSNELIEEQRTIGFIIRVKVTDPDGLGDITSIYIYDKTNDSYFILKDKSELNPKADCFQIQEIIECSFYSKDHPDEMNLTGYELVAVDFHGYVSRKTFEFKLPAGGVVGDEETVCSDELFCGPPLGVKGLEVMTIDNNDMIFTFDGQDLHIEFVSKDDDDKVKEYGLSIYDDSSIPVLVGEVSFDSLAIKAAPIVTQVKTEVDIPFTQIEFEDGFDKSDIYGLHVVLFDKATTSTLQSTTGRWFNYYGFSEFITLPE